MNTDAILKLSRSLTPPPRHAESANEASNAYQYRLRRLDATEPIVLSAIFSQSLVIELVDIPGESTADNGPKLFRNTDLSAVIRIELNLTAKHWTRRENVYVFIRLPTGRGRAKRLFDGLL